MITPNIEAATRVPALTLAQTDFLAQFAMLLGLSAQDGSCLVAPHTFTGPSGLVCRVRLADDKVAVRPQVLLPMLAEELAGTDVSRLLAMQEMLLGEFGWHLGLSPEGLLQLSPLTWLDDPQRAATALDLANGVANVVLQALLQDDAGSEVLPS